MNPRSLSASAPLLATALLMCRAVHALPSLTVAAPAPVVEGGVITVEISLSEPAPADGEFLWQLAPVAGEAAMTAHRDYGDIDPYPVVTGSAPSPRGDRTGVVRVQPGGTAVQLKFTTRQDYWMEPAEKLQLRITGGVNLTVPAVGTTLTVLDDDGVWCASATPLLAGPPFYHFRRYFLHPLDGSPPGTAVQVDSDVAHLPPNFTTWSPLPASSALTDFNHDGLPDIVSHYVQDRRFVVRGLLGGVAPPQNVWFDKTVHEDASEHGTIACGDVDGDGQPEIITGRGPGTAPTVTVWSTGGAQVTLAAWNVFDGVFGGGVNVAAGDLDGDGRDEIVTAAGPHGGPLVQWWKWTASGPVPGGSFWAYGLASTTGVAVGVGDTDGDGLNEIVCLPQETDGTSLFLVIYDPRRQQVVRNFTVPNPWFVTFDVPLKQFWITGLPGRPGFPQNRILYGTSNHEARVVHADNSVTVLASPGATTSVNVPVWPLAEPGRSSQPLPALPVLSLMPVTGAGVQWSAQGLSAGGEYDIETSVNLRTWTREQTHLAGPGGQPFVFSGSVAGSAKRFWRMAATSPVAGR